MQRRASSLQKVKETRQGASIPAHAKQLELLRWFFDSPFPHSVRRRLNCALIRMATTYDTVGGRKYTKSALQSIRLGILRLRLKVYIPFRVAHRVVALQAAAEDSTALDTDTHQPYYCRPSMD